MKFLDQEEREGTRAYSRLEMRIQQENYCCNQRAAINESNAQRLYSIHCLFVSPYAQMRIGRK